MSSWLVTPSFTAPQQIVLLIWCHDQSTPFCSRWHPVATAGMGASVSGRHERLAALLIPARSGNTWAVPGKRRAHDYGVLPYASW